MNGLNYLFRLIAYCLLFNLSACALLHSNVKQHLEINQCQVLCAKRFDLCQHSCTDNSFFCAQKANYTAKLSYDRYIQQEKVSGGYRTRGLKSYRDPLQCRKVTCNCYADAMDCKQNCIKITKSN